ncbi:MAG: HEAT repeat domain-containing protein [Kiritimatiellaeota bacterium]|nr:HEAT repeat domain-containing protein [Kiritimatiellota bacterium]
MRRLYSIGLTLCALLAAGTSRAHPGVLEGAQWIWFATEPPVAVAQLPPGSGYFRAGLAIPEKTRIATADLIITADNLYTVYLNGKLAGESATDPDLWHRPKRFAVADLLRPGWNIVAVEAVNTASGPAGLLVKMAVQMADGQNIALTSDANWKAHDQEEPNWFQIDFNDQAWPQARMLCAYGALPWGALLVPDHAEPAGLTTSAVTATAPADYPWPEGIVFVGEDCSLYRPKAGTGTSYDSLTVTLFNPRDTRAFPEHDLPAPMKVGRKLLALQPAKPGVTPRLLLDAGQGGLGSPSVSFDGRWIYVSMAREREPFFHLFRVPAADGAPQQLTDGPFHDIDPAELPDGRIVFTSTRMGRFEEYHNTPSRALFVMQADGRDIRPLTHTFIFDNEPEVMADGRILFIRSDNFFGRGKVETLLHALHPDGTAGCTEFGLDLGPEYGGRLRAFSCGSPAPMPDGRVAFLTGTDIAVGHPGCAQRELLHLPVEAGDVAALPDGRLLCTVPRPMRPTRQVKAQPRINHEVSYGKIGIVDPRGKSAQPVILLDSPEAPLHSPVYLGPRSRSPQLAAKVNRGKEDDPGATGVLFCQNARFTKNTTAGWSQVRAIRVLAGKGLTTRSSHSYIVHAGSDVTELGTVPLAPDGSFAVEVPADTAIAFQAVDAEGRSELNEMSWIYVRPGEARGCVGCHQPRQVTPPAAGRLPQAMQTPPLKLLGRGQPHRFRGNNAAVTGLMEMQFDRYREVAGINRHSATAAVLDTGAQEVRALLAVLQQGGVAQRISAAQRLAIFRDPAAAPALAQNLRAADRELRVAAALALAACGTRASAPPLLSALADPDPLVRQTAALALENLTGQARPFNAFAEPATRAEPVQSWSAWFKETGWDKIEQELIRWLENTDRDVVRRAAVALGHTGGDAARTALRAYVTRARENNPLPAWRKHARGDGAMFNAQAAVNPRTLQAATRALGSLRDMASVPMLAETLQQHKNPETANLFLAEAAAEALGRIGTPEAEAALLNAFAALAPYPDHTRWYGDHEALIACHAAPVHYLITEALDYLGSTRAGPIIPHLIRSVPTDPDRALLPANDDCEALVGRVIRRSGQEGVVVDTCLGILGDAQAVRNREIEQALQSTYQAWGGKPDPENRAAQILSLVCRDRSFEPRIRAAFDRYRIKAVDIPRVFDTGIPVVTKLPVRHWVCFYLARTLGNLADAQSVGALVAALEQSPPEAASGRPDPLGPGVLFLHNDLTPCWRAAAAWALGRIGDRRARPALLNAIRNLDNATDTRHAAAEALGLLATPADVKEINRLAAGYPEVSTRRALLEIGRPADVAGDGSK